jgi:Kef-type K+ transport system membrane component KefB
MINLKILLALNNFELTRFFFAIILLFFNAQIFGYIFQRYKMPKVIGEITGGILLGPTFLGFFFPQAYKWIFNAYPVESSLLSIIYWFGLILLMFISGFEVQRSVDKSDKKIIIAILIGATIVPFIAGWIIPYFYNFSPFLGIKNNMLSLRMIIAIAVAVTSIPVISKIFIDLNIINTRFAKIVLITATIEDVFLWIALAIATGIVSSETIAISNIIVTVFITFLFFIISLLIIPKWIDYANKLRFNILFKSSVSGYILFICFFFAALASLLNVNIVFGAFLAGILVGSMQDKRIAVVKNSIKEIAFAFFVPIYFAIIGFKIDLIHNFDIMFFGMFLLFCIIFKTIGTMLAAKIVNQNWLQSFNFAVAMNARGGPGIVLATVAYDIGIINEDFFVVLVMVSIITSLAAGYWLKFVVEKKWELMK